MDFSYYQTLFCNLNCANISGRKVLAKPVLLYTIIDSIESGIIIDNHFEWNTESPSFIAFANLYKDVYQGLCPNVYITPLYKPFFHLQHEGFWHHKVNPYLVCSKTAYITYLRSCLEYAYLDSDLWNLLQNPSLRDEYRGIILNHYFK